jgi:hypothetical protein
VGAAGIAPVLVRSASGMERILIAAAIVVAVAVVAFVVRARRRPDAPTQRRYAVPHQLDRNDFADPSAPWLVVVFSSATCDVCASVVDKAKVLASTEVAVAEVEYGADPALHQRYSVSAVPTTVVVDADGVTRAGFIGSVTATDLWAAVAEVREPGSSPEPGLGRP